MNDTEKRAGPGLWSLLRSVLVGVLIGVAILYWPVAAPEATPDGQSPLVQIYTTATCGYCKLLRKYLQARGITYADHDIERNRDAWQAFQAAGARGVPFVVIGAHRIEGFNPVAIERALAAAGLHGAPSTGS